MGIIVLLAATKTKQFIGREYCTRLHIIASRLGLTALSSLEPTLTEDLQLGQLYFRVLLLTMLAEREAGTPHSHLELFPIPLTPHLPATRTRAAR